MTDTKFTALLPEVNETENEAIPAEEIFPETDLEKLVSTGIDCPDDILAEKKTNQIHSQ